MTTDKKFKIIYFQFMLYS